MIYYYDDWQTNFCFIVKGTYDKLEDRVTSTCDINMACDVWDNGVEWCVPIA